MEGRKINMDKKEVEEIIQELADIFVSVLNELDDDKKNDFAKSKAKQWNDIVNNFLEEA